ncbi:MAG: Arm DNA-binding domain-containing protein [Algibacter sp.]|uniref:Arm DNA-binding domain-containing protein n=1 Tax=Algibacter sp. TaxID=1872428 RepID=UPI00260645FC|nr:Arm DNA-binding domain-containing protein [Algibacter sp.]MDG1729439.1 Arm DNA-binding domain-containing protein [Algibacter sp.]MDG2178625.1 Arm DNA-binding domain-containing protein [Algibacter sp.]
MKTRSTFTVIFFTRKSRSTPNQISIYVRITVNGKRSEISLKRSIDQNQWDSTKNRGRGQSERIKVLNAYLDGVYNKLLQCHKELLEEDKIVSADAIKSRYLGEDDTSKTLKELIAYHNGNMMDQVKKLWDFRIKQKL